MYEDCSQLNMADWPTRAIVLQLAVHHNCIPIMCAVLDRRHFHLEKEVFPMLRVGGRVKNQIQAIEPVLDRNALWKLWWREKSVRGAQIQNE